MKENKQVQPGTTYNYRGDKYHVVAIIEDEGDKIAVLKRWNKYSQCWRYLVQDLDFVQEDVERDRNTRRAQRCAGPRSNTAKA